MTFALDHVPEALSGLDLAPVSGPLPHALSGFPTRAVLQLGKQGVALCRDKHVSEASVFDWCERAQNCLSFLAEVDPAYIWIWQDQLLPILLSSDFLRRCREQPRGYAGDYLTIQAMYDRAAHSKDRFGRAVDAWSMSQPCPKA